jgi:hypothetical protein
MEVCYRYTSAAVAVPVKQVPQYHLKFSTENIALRIKNGLEHSVFM